MKEIISAEVLIEKPDFKGEPTIVKIFLLDKKGKALSVGYVAKEENLGFVPEKLASYYRYFYKKS